MWTKLVQSSCCSFCPYSCWVMPHCQMLQGRKKEKRSSGLLACLLRWQHMETLSEQDCSCYGPTWGKRLRNRNNLIHLVTSLSVTPPGERYCVYRAGWGQWFDFVKDFDRAHFYLLLLRNETVKTLCEKKLCLNRMCWSYTPWSS